MTQLDFWTTSNAALKMLARNLQVKSQQLLYNWIHPIIIGWLETNNFQRNAPKIINKYIQFDSKQTPKHVQSMETPCGSFELENIIPG